MERVAAIAPEYQALREKEAILQDETVKKYLEELQTKIREIAEIAILDNGSKQYIVKTEGTSFIRVNVVYNRSKERCGPLPFVLEVFSPEIHFSYPKGLVFPRS